MMINKESLIRAFVLFFIATVLIIYQLNVNDKRVFWGYTVMQKNVSTKTGQQSSYMYNVIFIETNHKSDVLTSRQLCSIESAAKHNPHALVRVFSMNAQLKQTYLHDEYPNIQFNKLDVGETVKNTPLEEWWASGRLSNVSDYFRFAHLSDALRLLLLYKYAGVYADLDMVTIGSYSELVNYTTIGIQSPDKLTLGNSFITASKIHDKFIYECLKQFPKSYNAKAWAGNGLHLLNSVLNRYCKIKTVESLMSNTNNYPNSIYNDQFKKHNNTCGVYVLPFYVTFPKHWKKAFELFLKNSKMNIETLLYSKAIHFNNKITNEMGLHRHDKSIMEFLFKFNCPLVYDHEIVL